MSTKPPDTDVEPATEKPTLARGLYIILDQQHLEDIELASTGTPPTPPPRFPRRGRRRPGPGNDKFWEYTLLAVVLLLCWIVGGLIGEGYNHLRKRDA